MRCPSTRDVVLGRRRRRLSEEFQSPGGRHLLSGIVQSYQLSSSQPVSRLHTERVTPYVSRKKMRNVTCKLQQEPFQATERDDQNKLASDLKTTQM